jgi:hypothetical protein
MTRKKQLALEIIPPKTITLTEDQFRELGEKIQAARKPNPMPWAILGLAVILIAVVGSVLGAVAIMDKPVPIVYQVTPNVPAARTDTPVPTVTKTPTATVTPDMTRTMEGSPAFQTVRDYFSFVRIGDFGRSWNLLTERCQWRECWTSWKGDYEEFKTWWYQLGPVDIRQLKPEIVDAYQAQCYILLYFQREEMEHPYRVFLIKSDGGWLIHRIEYLYIMKK